MKKQVRNGYWYRVAQFETCCDCGLCHQKEYKVIIKKGEAKVFFRAWRDEKRTAENRKVSGRKHKLIGDK